ncbi:MAG: CoA transferase subunit A [Firmicutes bacterium]|nr:CoA transferase subunit A [Bacillota bacterium]
MSGRSKVMTLTEAIEQFVHDGALISLGGFSATQCPMAAVHEIIRQGIKNLHVAACSNGQAVDELIGGGCVERIEIAYGGNGRFAPTCFRFRRGIERGEVKVEDYSNYQMTLRFMAGAMGVPFLPTYSSLGTDIVNRWGFDEGLRRQDTRLPLKKLEIMDNPFNRTGQVDRLVLVPALQPDVTIIHAQKADAMGNVRLMGLVYSDIEQAKASKHVIVTCEEIVETDDLRKEPERNQIIGIQVSAVVKVPWGAYPAAVYGYYDYDPWFLTEFYPKVAKDDEKWQQYIEDYVLGVKDRQGFLELIGLEKVERLRADEGYGYNRSLKRR